MSEPREWWIDPHEHSAPYRRGRSGKFTAWDDNVRPGLIRVIEKSAYNALKLTLEAKDLALSCDECRRERDEVMANLQKTIVCLRQIFDAFPCDVWPRSLIMDVRRDISLDMDWKKKE